MLSPLQIQRSLRLASATLLIAATALYMLTPLIPWPDFPLSAEENAYLESLFEHDRDAIRASFLLFSSTVGCIMALVSVVATHRRNHFLIASGLIAYGLASMLFAY